MFGKLVETWNTAKAIREVERHPIVSLALINLRDTLNNTSEGIGKYWSEENKQALITRCITELAERLAQPNPVQAVRIRTIEYLISTTKIDVLLMKPPTPFKWLSGELTQHIPALSNIDKELEEYFYGLESMPTELNAMADALLGRYWMLHLMMSTFGVVRYKLGDMNPDAKKDWFRACYLSYCIWQEDNYRNELRLPSIIDGPSADMKAVMLSTWMNRAQEGQKELRLAWEKSWEEAFQEPSPFTDLEM